MGQPIDPQGSFFLSIQMAVPLRICSGFHGSFYSGLLATVVCKMRGKAMFWEI